MTENNGFDPVKARYTRSTMMSMSPEARLDALYSDGMWYDESKACSLMNVSVEEYQRWLAGKLASSSIIASTTGAVTYRFNMEQVREWHDRHNMPLDAGLFEGIYPARVWDGMTETEGFIAAPLREVCVVTFTCGESVAREVADVCRGVGVVKPGERAGQWRLLCGSESYGAQIVAAILGESLDSCGESARVRRASMWRRDMRDFTPEFTLGMFDVYEKFARSRLAPHMDSLRIFLTDRGDVDAKVIEWVIGAIERFNEKASVPFSGYLDNILHKWPYDVAEKYLGKRLAGFQKKRAVAIKKIKKREGDSAYIASVSEIASEMGLPLEEYLTLEGEHKSWLADKNARALTWGESGEEKESVGMVGGHVNVASLDAEHEGDARLTANLFRAWRESGDSDSLIRALVFTGSDGSQVFDASELGDGFVAALARACGIGEEKNVA